MSLPRFATIRGEIAAFDEAAGWGRIRTENGDEAFFHCTRISDGTRTIPVGVTAEAVVQPIGIGRWEAVEVRQLSG